MKTPGDFIFAKINKISKQTKATFLSACLFGIFAHIFVMTNAINNYDNISCTPKGIGTGITSGRWMLEIYKKLEGIWEYIIFRCLMECLRFF